MLKSLLLPVLAAALAQGPPAPRDARPTADELARTAWTAAFRYESLQRRLAPPTWDSGRRGDACDERIGRFCLWYDAPDERPAPPPPPDPPEVEDARTVAVRAHRRWFSSQPEHPEAAGALIRYLIESDRAPEAVAAARTHVWAAGRTPACLLLLGLALHEAGDFAAAEAVFDSARGRLPAEERDRLDDARVLLERRERGRYADLSASERRAYNTRLWALSDPSLLDPGNERRSAHYARHAWATIFSRAPRVRGKVSWGDDHAEILLRFGLPSGRKRIRDFRPHLLSEDPRFIETFRDDAVALVPPALITRGLPHAPPPGVRHELTRDTAPSSYAPVRLRLRPLDHALTRVPKGDGAVLRIDALLRPDTIEPAIPASPQALVVVLDTLGSEIARALAAVRRTDEAGTVLHGSVEVPAGAWVYRIELLDEETALAGLAQYRVDVPPPLVPAAAGARAQALRLSDLVVAEPFGDAVPMAHDDPLLAPHPDLVLPPGARVGLFAEAHGLRRDGTYTVEWSVEREPEGSLLGAAVRWLGRQLGVLERQAPLRIRYEDVSVGGVAPISVNMDLPAAEPGLYRITLRVVNRVTGETRSADRLVRLAGATPVPARR